MIQLNVTRVLVNLHTNLVINNSVIYTIYNICILVHRTILHIIVYILWNNIKEFLDIERINPSFSIGLLRATNVYVYIIIHHITNRNMSQANKILRLS